MATAAAATTTAYSMSDYQFKKMLREKPLHVDRSFYTNKQSIEKTGDFVDLAVNLLRRYSKKTSMMLELKVSDDESWKKKRYGMKQFIIQTKKGDPIEILRSEGFANQRFEQYEKNELAVKAWTKWTR